MGNSQTKTAKNKNYDKEAIETLIQVWHHDEEIKTTCENLVQTSTMLMKNKGMHTKY